MAKNSILTFYENLSEIELLVARIFSVNYFELDINEIKDCIEKYISEFNISFKPTQKNIKEVLKKLHSKKIIIKGYIYFKINNYIAEKVAIDIAKDDLWSKFITSLVEKDSYYYFYYEYKLLRDIRVFLYSNDYIRFMDGYAKLCKTNEKNTNDALKKILDSFQEDGWFDFFDINIKFFLFSFLFQSRVLKFGFSKHIYTMLDEFCSSPDLIEGYKNLALIFRAESALLCGDFDIIYNIFDIGDKVPDLTSGYYPSILALQGDVDQAIDIFESELKMLRGVSKSKSIYFSGIPGLIYTLLMIIYANDDSYDYVLKLIKNIKSKINKESFSNRFAGFFEAMLIVKKGENKKACSLIEKNDFNFNFGIFLKYLTIYIVEQKINSEQKSELKRLYNIAKRSGFKWIALEIASLLIRVKKDVTVFRKNSAGLEKATGINSLVKQFALPETWERDLLSLRHILGTSNTLEENRVVWAWKDHERYYELEPKLQKIKKNGTGWTAGRRLALNTLIDKEIKECTEQDLIIANILSKNRYSYKYDYEYKSNLFSSLIDHPLIFDRDHPDLRIEFFKDEVELVLKKEGDNYVLSLSKRIGEEECLLVKYSPTRYGVVVISKQQRELASVLGKGMKIPKQGKEQLFKLASGFATQMTFHSDIQGLAEDVPEVETDSSCFFHLYPAAEEGIRVQVFVLPLGADGPYLKPGKGTVSVMATVEGRKVQTHRDLQREQENHALVLEDCPLLEQSDENGVAIFEDLEDSLEILMALKSKQDQGVAKVFWPEGESLKVHREASFDKFSLNSNQSSNWLELDGELEIDQGQVLSIGRLLELIQDSPGRFILLDDGKYLALTQKIKRRLEQIKSYSEVRGDTARMHPLAAMGLEGLEEDFISLKEDKNWNKRLQKIEQARLLDPEISPTFKAELRDYQVQGYKWLSRLAGMGLGACLADDMGLGKTIQALAALVDRAPQGPALVIAPTSVCMNWQDEALRFAPTLNCYLLASEDRKKLIEQAGAMDLVICSYGLLQQEGELLASKQWHTLILDEAQAIKNPMAKRTQAAMKLQADFKFVTTGTPLENHLGEFYTLFRFINPGLLGSSKSFQERFALPIEKNKDKKVRRHLRQLVQPFILRRTKSKVLEELPERTEILLKVEMSPEESAFYEAVRQKAIKEVEEMSGPEGSKHLKILAQITRLRQACCNPRLVIPDSSLPSSKLEAFAELVQELRANNHKALVFSQFVTHLALIKEFLDGQNIDYRYLDGSTPQKKRKQEVDAFQAGRGDIFLISLKAGGFGLNLTAADYVIHMDPWWNPAVEDQASDRAHRIGQKRPVTIYRLVTKHTIEEKIVALHQRKKDLANSLLEGSDLSGKVSAQELLELIRQG